MSQQQLLSPAWIQQLQRTWTAPVELGPSMPRQSQWAPSGLGFIAVTVAIMAAGVFTAMQSPDKLQQRLNRDGVDADGTITSTYRAYNDSTTVDYRYEVGGRAYFGSKQAPLGTPGTFTAGSHLVVRYLSADPSISHPSAWREPLSLAALGFGLFLAAVGAGLLAVPMRDKGLLLRGQPAMGVVTGYGHGRGGMTFVCYHFVLPDGTLHRGAGGGTYRVPPIGNAIDVIYDPLTPKHNAPYPMEKVRLARPWPGTPVPAATRI